MAILSVQDRDRNRPQAFAAGAVRGASTAEIQKLLTAFAERRRREGFRLAGAIEEPAVASDCDCRSLVLRSLSNNHLFPITQNLGSGSSACKLDTRGLAEACQSILQAIDDGADLVVLSKFGKIETEGGGFVDVFRAAVDANIPCLAGVKPSFAKAYLDYAGEFSEWVKANDDALDRWWTGCLTPAKALAAE